MPTILPTELPAVTEAEILAVHGIVLPDNQAMLATGRWGSELPCQNL